MHWYTPEYTEELRNGGTGAQDIQEAGTRELWENEMGHNKLFPNSIKIVLCILD